MLLKKHLQSIFGIILPDEFWEKFKTPRMLMDEVAFVDVKLNLNVTDSKNLWDLEKNTKLYKPSINPMFYALEFLRNSICSNIYLYQNLTQGDLKNNQ